MEWSCKKCGGMGDVPINDYDEAIFIVCSNCSHPSAYAWCEKCGEGKERDEIDLSDQPEKWICNGCNKEYRFPPLFYQRVIYFNPSEFVELDYVDEIDFHKYEHVNVDWVRNALQFWKKHRITPYLMFVIAFILFVIFLFISEDSIFTTIFGAFWFVSFLATILIDIITLLVSTSFLLIYKIKQKQES